MTNTIVTTNVSQIVAPAPSKLQKTGALIAQGATNTAAGTKTLLTSAADLTAILAGALALSSITWSGGVATATTAAPHGYANAEVVKLTVAGATPAGYNGTFNCTITGASTFTYPLAVNPGAETVPGTYTPEDVAELLAMVTTFFAQGSQQAVYVLELGKGNAADGVTYLTTWLAANPGIFYAYLLPRYWADEASFLTFLAGFEATTSKTYFFVTMTAQNYTSFTAAMKCVVGLVEAPAVAATEFSLAAALRVALNYDPSSANRVTPFAFSDLFGVTPYPAAGNATLLAALKAASVNYVGTGAEGGITNSLLYWGTTMDGRDFTYWYSVDWVQINVPRALAAAVINGSNNPLNPLYYNQDGINRLQAVVVQMMQSAISFGLALGAISQTQLSAPAFQQALDAQAFAGKVEVNADPFFSYASENPNDYKAGKYAGLSVVYTPNRGFTQIVFNVTVNDFVAP